MSLNMPLIYMLERHKRHSIFSITYSQALPLLPESGNDRGTAASQLAKETWAELSIQKWSPDNNQPGNTVIPRSFPLFGSLPFELQDMIWCWTLQPMVFQGIHVLVDETEFKDENEGKSSSPEQDQAMGFNSSSMLIGHARRPIRDIPLFHVSRRSRCLAVRLYGDPQKGHMLFNPEIDVVILDNSVSCTCRRANPFTFQYYTHGIMMARTGTGSTISLEPLDLPGGNSSDGTASEILQDRGHVDYYYGYSSRLLQRVRNIETIKCIGWDPSPSGCLSDGVIILEVLRTTWSAVLPNVRRLQLNLLLRPAGGPRVGLNEDEKAEEMRNWTRFVHGLLLDRGFWPGLRHIDFARLYFRNPRGRMDGWTA